MTTASPLKGLDPCGPIERWGRYTSVSISASPSVLRRRHSGVFGLGPAIAAWLLLFSTLVEGTACADTISGALARAYMGNPMLNQQRAATRASDETVSMAKAPYRPQVVGSGSSGLTHVDGVLIDGPARGTGPLAAVDLTVSQNLFNGLRTANGVRQAESAVMGQRALLARLEQQVIRDAAVIYMDVLRDAAVLALDANNIAVLREQLRHTRDRYAGGEVTPTDIAQTASSLATARSTYFTAKAELQTSVAQYRRIVGLAPKRLEAARPIDDMLPRTLDDATAEALAIEPSIVQALQDADAASLQVQLDQGRLAPTLDAVGIVQRTNASEGVPGDRFFSAGVRLQANVPIYSGGDVHADVRRSKEIAARARLEVDVRRNAVRASVVAAWGRREASKSVVTASRAAIGANEVALLGVREEARAGQRTTLDVLRAEQALLDARVRLVGAQRDRVVVGYDLAAAIGSLSAARLGLGVEYDPSLHLDQVKDRWFGLRTPDGR